MKKILASFFIIIALFSAIAFFNVKSTMAFSGPGTGASADPYRISSCNQLQEISNSLSSYYVVTSNIDCSTTTAWNSGQGFVPLTTFTGSFDGRNHTIDGLYMNRSGNANGNGLFGIINNATIKNVSLTNASTTFTSGYYTGGIVGSASNSNISGVSFSGNILGPGAGGVVSFLQASSSLSHSAGHGSVIDNGGWGGGLTNFIYDSSVADSYTDAAMVGSNTVGGLASRIYIQYGSASVVRSYAGGTVKSSNYRSSFISSVNTYGSGTINFTDDISASSYVNDADSYKLTNFYGYTPSSQYTPIITNGVFDATKANGGTNTACGAYGTQTDCTNINSNTLINTTTAAPFMASGTQKWDFNNVWQVQAASLPTLRSTIISPEAPTAATSSNINGSSATLTWTAPAVTGGAAITSYVVNYRKQGVTAWTQINTGSTNASYTLSGLATSTTYQFEIAAVNSAGQGLVSDTGSFTTASNNNFTLAYTAGAGGTLSGSTTQIVASGLNGSAVAAIPNTGYSFVSWSDASTTNPRTDRNVTGNISVTANFTINSYTLNYSAGTEGSITGSSSQTVNYGADGSAVTAVPNNGYAFSSWSDGSTANPRTDTNVIAALSVTANFNSAGSSRARQIANGIIQTTQTTQPVATTTVVATTTQANIIVVSGGTTSLTNNDTTLKVTAPSGFTTAATQVLIQIKPVADTTIALIGAPNNKLQPVHNNIFDITASAGSQTIDSFSLPVTVSINYSQADVAGFIESTLWLYHYHNNAWAPLSSCVVDTTANTVTCSTQSFFTFELFGEATTTPETCDAPKQLVCQINSSDRNTGDTICIASEAVNAHLKQGDLLGECEPAIAARNLAEAKQACTDAQDASALAQADYDIASQKADNAKKTAADPSLKGNTLKKAQTDYSNALAYLAQKQAAYQTANDDATTKCAAVGIKQKELEDINTKIADAKKAADDAKAEKEAAAKKQKEAEDKAALEKKAADDAKAEKDAAAKQQADAEAKAKKAADAAAAAAKQQADAEKKEADDRAQAEAERIKAEQAAKDQQDALARVEEQKKIAADEQAKKDEAARLQNEAEDKAAAEKKVADEAKKRKDNADKKHKEFDKKATQDHNKADQAGKKKDDAEKRHEKFDQQADKAKAKKDAADQKQHDAEENYKQQIEIAKQAKADKDAATKKQHEAEDNTKKEQAKICESYQALKSIPKDLTLDQKVGSKNDEVKRVQQFLNINGYNVAKSGTGSRGKESNLFGSKTAKALAQLQKDYSIEGESGIVGPNTREFINSINDKTDYALNNCPENVPTPESTPTSTATPIPASTPEPTVTPTSTPTPTSEPTTTSEPTLTPTTTTPPTTEPTTTPTTTSEPISTTTPTSTIEPATTPESTLTPTINTAPGSTATTVPAPKPKPTPTTNTSTPVKSTPASTPVIPTGKTAPVTTAPTTTGGSAVCTPYLLKYIKAGRNNDPVEVRKLQDFLHTYEGFTSLKVTGVYDAATERAVVAFQKKYQADVLGPWNIDDGTGYVYKTTLKKINELYCSESTQTNH